MRKSLEPRILPSQITSQSVYLQRRKLLAALGLGAAAWSVGLGAAAVAAVEPGRATGTSRPARAGRVRVGQPTFSRNARYRSTEPLTSFEDATTYNNFYEFGTDKTDPRERAGSLRPEPWSVELSGECEARGKLTLEDVLKPHALEERIYRFRCVEAWSMVVPWLGFPLADLIRRARPTSRAKYVEFTTLLDPAQMPGQRTGLLDWPYVEGLRMDEAMHPLAFIAVGLYGQWLPNQNGAPLRLVVPWKYGFKSIKSIVRLRFVEREPRTTWNVMAADEYGFYANVNPAVDHPRWSQARERRLGSNIFAPRIETLPFNGYANDVAGLYRGMDLTRYY